MNNRRSQIVLIVGLALALTAQAGSPRAFDPFAGKWTGALEYQDYGGTGRVKIPVTLEIRPTGAAQASWNFVYDDFGRDVTSFETHRWVTGRYTVSTRGKPDIQRFTSRDFGSLASAGQGRAVLLGREQENGAQVEVRRTVTLGTTTLTTLTETRAPGGAFAFRNQSIYTRQR